MDSVGLAGPAVSTPVDNSSAGTRSSEDDLLSALGADDASEQSAGAEADASGKPGGDDLSQPSAQSDDQGSGPADEGQENGKARKRDRVQERIDELIARSKTAEETNRALQAQLDELRTKLDGKGEKQQDAEGGSSGFDPASSDPKFGDLSKQVAKAKSEIEAARTMRRRLRQEPDVVLELLKSKGIDVADADQAADWLDDYTEGQRERYAEAREGVAKRKAELDIENDHAQRAWSAAAEARYEWVKDEADPRHQLIANAQKQHPWVMRFPAGRAALVALADMAYHAKQQRQGTVANPQNNNGGARPSTVRPTTSDGGGPSARPGANPGASKGAREAALARRLDQNPDDDEALTELLDGNL